MVPPAWYCTKSNLRYWVWPTSAVLASTLLLVKRVVKAMGVASLAVRGFKVQSSRFKVLLSFSPLGARKQSSIHTLHSLKAGARVLLINYYRTLHVRQERALTHRGKTAAVICVNDRKSHVVGVYL